MRAEKEKEKLEKKRKETLSIIDESKSEIELMVQRPRADGDALDEATLQKVRLRLAEIEDRAKQSAQLDELGDLSEEADAQGTFSAYFCPKGEILIEGQLTFTLMDWWGIPRSEMDNLRALLLDELKKADPVAARSALSKLLSERNEWDDYKEFYEDMMKLIATRLFVAIVGLLLVAIVSLRYSYLSFPLVICGLLTAGCAGSCTSVILKLPILEASNKENADGYLRRVLSRIAAGTVASLAGCGLLSWNLIPISVQGHTFAEYLNACAGCASAQCTSLSSLILLAVAIMFGFWERALSSFEERIFGKPPSKSGKA